MRRVVLPIAAAAALIACVAKDKSDEPQPPREREIFDGRSLANWDGDPKYWSVENGCIVGRSTAQNPLDHTTYLLYRGPEVADFELHCRFKIVGGNSGVQFRSRDRGGWNVAGYQADIEDGASWTGCLYEQEGRAVVATRGQHVELDGGSPKVTTVGDAAEILSHVRVHDWNDYVVRAVGDEIAISINGVRTCEVVDRDPRMRSHAGLLALQLHQGAPMQVEFKDFRLLDLGSTPIAASAPPTPAIVPFPGQLPQWIWPRDHASDGERAAFSRRFVLPAGVTGAKLRGACDNRMRVFVNGEFAVEARDWEKPVEVDVGKLVHAGENELAIVGLNEGGPAAMWIDFVAEANGKRALRVTSDASWSSERLADDVDIDPWTPAQLDRARASVPHVAGAFGVAPWGSLGMQIGAPAKPEPETFALAADQLVLPEGFHAELLYSVPKGVQGSWVSMCEDPRGRLYVSDQYGGLFRVTPPPFGGDASATRVETVPCALGEAQGMCWAFDSLYVVVSKGDKYESGLYRVRDSDGDDQLDNATLLRKFDGSGEHGPHAVELGPDGKLWIMAGNHTKLPEPIDNYRLPKTWGEDHLLPVIEDPNGHAVGIRAPGGWLVRTDEDGKSWELWAGGFRNAYDFAFDPNGDVFTYDSDMEWDMGAPWYKAPRFLHVVSGADFGWRSGTANWPTDYPDTLPSVCESGPASPTGVAFGTNAKFPEKYRRALYGLDWAYGTIYAVHLERKGASYTGTLEKFCTGKPFPVTDVVVAKDGAMYVSTGGRRTQSGLYRITAVSAGVQASASPPSLTERVLAGVRFGEPVKSRRAFESYHSATTPEGTDIIGSDPNVADAFVRNAAFVALEHGMSARAHLSSHSWEGDLIGLLAGVHTGEVDGNFEFSNWRFSERLAAGEIDYLRVLELVLLRCPKLDERTRKEIKRTLELVYPQPNVRVNRELAMLLVYLDSAMVIEPLLATLEGNAIQEEKIHAAYCLRALKSGWSLEQRKRFFTSVDALREVAKGGFSLTKYIDEIRRQSVAALTDDEKLQLGELVAPKITASSGSAATASFVRAWNAEALLPKLREPLHARSFEHGKAAYAKANCAQCHRIGGEGGATGPDLTGAGSRFSRADLLDSLLEPSKAISDQYQDTEVVTKDGDLYVGRLERDDATGIALRRLPPSDELVELARDEIESRRLHPLSRMPSGLVDVLTEDEILDLFAYVLSGANEHDASFSP